MIKISNLTYYYYMLPILIGIFILCIFRIRHMVLDLHRTRRGLCQFFYLSRKRKVGTPGKGEGMAA